MAPIDHLQEEAEASQEVAACLYPFLSYIPECSTEINASMSELLAIAAALRELSTGLFDRHFRRNVRERKIVDDINLALPCLSGTIDEINYSFERLGITNTPGVQSYGRVWREIRSMSQGRSGSLLGRLESYRSFFVELIGRMTGQDPGPCDMKVLRQELAKIRTEQQDSLEEKFDKFNLGSPGEPPMAKPTTKPARKPAMKPTAEPATKPAFNPAPAEKPPRRRSRPPRGPEPEVPQWTPPAPEVFSSSSATTATSESSESVHWAQDVFDGRHTATVFPVVGATSKCFAKHNPDAANGLSRTMERLIDLDFDNSNLIASFFWNPENDAVKVLAVSKHPEKGSPVKLSISSLTNLRIFREGPCLKLFHAASPKQSKILWASLRFPTYERLILVHCLFTALKARGPQKYPLVREDLLIQREKELAAFKIDDDGFVHALRIFWDKDSGGARLEASVLRGELKGTPVWTAFINEYLTSSDRWASYEENKVYFTELRPYVFCSEYSPQETRDGHVMLEFTSSQNATKFLAVLFGLRSQR